MCIRCGRRIFRDLLLHLFSAVVGVPRKQLLHFLVSQQQHVLLLVLVLASLRYLVPVVFAAEDVLGHKRCGHVLFHEWAPGKALKPRVVLNFDHPIFRSKPVGRFPLDHLY